MMKSNAQVWLWMVFSLMSLLTGCNKDNDNTVEIVESDEYTPLVKEGKLFVYSSSHSYDGHLVYQLISGDTVIQGRQYKKVMGWDKLTENKRIYLGAIREENKKVYTIEPRFVVGEWVWKEVLMFDFGRSVGDEYYHEEYSIAVVKIVDIDTVENAGRKFRRFIWNLSYCTVQVPAQFNLRGAYVEGIGDGRCFFYSDKLDTKDVVYTLVRCEDNGKVIFDDSYQSFFIIGGEY